MQTVSPISHFRTFFLFHCSTFQDDLNSFFSTWEKILFHQEVIKFACGMTDNLDLFLQLIFDRLVTHLHEPDKYFNNSKKVLLQSIERELPDDTNISMLNNKYFNFIGKDNPVVFIPSRFYELSAIHVSRDVPVTFLHP